MLTKSKIPNKGPKINSPFSSFDLFVHHGAFSFSLSILYKFTKHYTLVTQIVGAVYLIIK